MDRFRLNSWLPPSARSRFWRFSAHSVLQIAGQILPLVVAAVAIPVIYRRVGAAEFGVFTIALSALGLFSVMDLGLGRATVRFAARALAEGDAGRAASITVQSAMLLGGFSLFLCLAFVLFVPSAAAKWVQAPSDMGSSVRHVVYILAASIPFIGVTSALRSALEAKEEFPLIALIQATFGSLTYGVALALSLVTDDVRVIVAGAVICRVLTFFAFLAAARARWGESISWKNLSLRSEIEFLRFSGWQMVSNFAGNGVAYADRALLPSIVPLASVPFYNVPVEMLSRMLVVVNGAVTVAFPLLSKVATNEAHLERIHVVSLAFFSALLAPGFLLLSVAAPAGLDLWLGSEFREHSTDIVRILLVGILFLSLNAFALASLNAQGVARRVALMHVGQVPFYIWALLYFGHKHGLLGVAAVWSARMIAEYIFYTGIQVSVSATRSRRVQLGSAFVGASQAAPLIFMAVFDQALWAFVMCAVVTAATVLWAASTLAPRRNLVS